MQDNWKGIKEPLASTCHEVLGRTKHHKEYILVKTLIRIHEMKNKKTTINNSQTRAEKAKVNAGYRGANKRVNSSIKADKQKYLADLAMTAEIAAIERNMKQLYDITKKLVQRQ
ncbi:unnamed protein product [Schistosoma margrebowiei]|uniref:Uncharacterized protein n=1 Tax=Schistosoma margrebowiei TaxID=48269 RepID=A0A183MKN3_9TREM|nr:unnamed protein product [Schistosoma margrebowiei]